MTDRRELDRLVLAAEEKPEPDPKSRRLAIGCMAFVAVLALAAAGLQFFAPGADVGAYWRSLGSATIGAGWSWVAYFLSRK